MVQKLHGTRVCVWEWRGWGWRHGMEVGRRVWHGGGLVSGLYVGDRGACREGWSCVPGELAQGRSEVSTKVPNIL